MAYNRPTPNLYTTVTCRSLRNLSHDWTSHELRLGFLKIKFVIFFDVDPQASLAGLMSRSSSFAHVLGPPLSPSRRLTVLSTRSSPRPDQTEKFEKPTGDRDGMQDFVRRRRKTEWKRRQGASGFVVISKIIGA